MSLEGESKRAKDLGSRTFERALAVLGSQHLITLTAAAVLALVLATGDEAGRGLELGEETMERSRRMMGDEHFITLIAATAVVALRARVGDDRAQALGYETLRRADLRLPRRHPMIRTLSKALEVDRIKEMRGSGLNSFGG